MSGGYQDNLNHSLYNRRFIDFTIKRNSEIKQHELNHRVILNYGVNRNINNNMYAGYTNYLNGNPYSLIYQDKPLKSFVHNQGTINRNDRLTQSVKSVKKVGGYLIPYEDLPKMTTKATFGKVYTGIV